MTHVIIGVHGLANKPPREILERGWKDAICEGLANLNRTRISPDRINYQMADWADLYYPERDQDAGNRYKPATAGTLTAYDENVLDSLRGWFGNVVDEPVEWLKNRGLLTDAAEKVLETYIKDLDKYYGDDDQRRATRQVVMDRIQENAGKRILLIGHSMGSIITYDVLRILGDQNSSHVIDHYVTIGSPLGLPHVQSKIVGEFGKVRTPSVVKRWTNFADRRDPVALDSHLSRDFKPNSAQVRPVDDLVLNDWEGNSHKSYGYLRCPEFSEVVLDFL